MIIHSSGSPFLLVVGKKLGNRIPTIYSLVPEPLERGDGRAVLRSSIREFLASEAMHHLGFPAHENSILFGILWYPLWSKILSSFWGIVFYLGNIILRGSTTKKTLLMGLSPKLTPFFDVFLELSQFGCVWR